MKRKIITCFITSILLATQCASVSIVFSDELTGAKTIEQVEGDSVKSIENQIANDITGESVISTIESIGQLREGGTSTSEKEVISSDENVEKMTDSSKSKEVEEIASSIDRVTETESVFEESVEAIEYEEIVYRGQTFKFPIQKEVTEIEKNPNDNHELGAYDTSEKGVSNQIKEKQMNHPRWDFITVSSYNGELSVENYEAMKKKGVTGVVVKLTEGTFYKNPFAKNQIENAQKAGLKISTYHFSRYTTKTGAEDEAKYYAEEAKRLNLSTDTIMVNDFEVALNEYSTQNAIYFEKKLKELGFNYTIHYSSANIFEQSILSTSILDEKKLWVSEYPDNPTNENLLHSSKAAWQWSRRIEFTDIPGKEFSASIDFSGLFSNQAETIMEKKESEKKKPIISEKYIKEYVVINSKDFVFWKDLFLKEKNTISGNYFKNTFYAEKEYTLLDGSEYLELYNNNSQWLGYINKSSTTSGHGAQGPHQQYGEYVKVKGNYNIWNGFDWKSNKLGSDYKNQTFEARGFYDHFNGSRYLSLYDSQGKWHGYINEIGTTVGYGAQGPHQQYGEYVNVKGNYDIWNGFDWKSNKSGSLYKNQTLEARGFYDHFNGSRYLSLYDSQGKWHGYINEIGTTVGYGAQGPHQTYGKLVSVKGNYNIWNGFDWKSNKSGSLYKNQVFEARGFYDHFNGSRYLSLYDSQGKWHGYINEIGTELVSNAQGPYKVYGKYINIKGNYNIWNSFEWKSSKAGSLYKNQTFEARGMYDHSNGSRYLSLYDSQGKWLGYINELGTNLASDKQGNHQNYGKYVTIKSNQEPVYRNFNWELQKNQKLGKETFQAKGVYHHFNGSRYFSIYDLNNKWIGYISEKSIDEKPTHLFVMGHGSLDPGAVGNGTSEREFTRMELLPYLRKYAGKLKNSEIVFYDTSRNMYGDTKEKKGIHNIHKGLSSITEFHLDAAGIGATGGHIIVHPNKKSYKEDLELANVIKQNNGLWGGVTAKKGLSYRKDLLNLNISYDYNVSYRLAELGFITNYKDVAKLRVNLDKIAKEFVEVVTGEKL